MSKVQIMSFVTWRCTVVPSYDRLHMLIKLLIQHVNQSINCSRQTSNWWTDRNFVPVTVLKGSVYSMLVFCIVMRAHFPISWHGQYFFFVILVFVWTILSRGEKYICTSKFSNHFLWNLMKLEILWHTYIKTTLLINFPVPVIELWATRFQL